LRITSNVENKIVLRSIFLKKVKDKRVKDVEIVKEANLDHRKYNKEPTKPSYNKK
jgi:hypothetical protein